MAISGNTKILGLIAHPVTQARSPQMANEWLQQQQLQDDFALLPMQVASQHLSSFVNALRGLENFWGAIVSMPHKSAIGPLLDRVTDKAQALSAVNVIRRNQQGQLEGDILDGEGFVSGLLNQGHTISQQHCLLAGAGGAVSAVALALLEHGCASLTISNRTLSRAELLVQRVRALQPQAQIFSQPPTDKHYDILINATSLGMQQGDDLPFSQTQINQADLVSECVIAPEFTALLKTAKARSKKIHTGVPMLNAQIELMLRYMGAS